jgi:DNA-binding GntR family transcriptional regulator
MTRPRITIQGVDSTIEAVQFQSLAEVAAQNLRNAIIDGKLKPGERLVEQKLATQLDIGQPTLREALKELEHQGFVRKLANKGTYVTKLSEDDCRKILQVRMVLEVLAIEQAAANVNDSAMQDLEATVKEMDIAARKLERNRFHKADLAFHRRIWQLTDNEYLVAALERVVFSLFAFVLLVQDRKDFLAAVQQHREILEGLRSGDPKRAGETFMQSTNKFWKERHHFSAGV